MTLLLECTDITAGYGPLTVLKNLSLHVEKGEIVTIIGSNGAGKSTTLKVISRLLEAQSGTMKFQGEALHTRAACDLVSLGLAHVPEGRRVFPRLTVRENLELGAYTVRDPKLIKAQYDHILELFPILGKRSTQMAGTLSGGEQQMLAIGRALMSSPQLLLLDEPSMGIAPLIVEKIFQTLVNLNREGVTILLVEQNAHLALEISNRGYVLETGTITMTGSGKSLLNNPEVLDAYLGA